MAKNHRAVLLMGSPAAGKTTYARSSLFDGFEYVDVHALGADHASAGKQIHSLMYHGKDFVLDGDNGTVAERKFWVNAIRSYPQSLHAPKYQVECHYIKTTLNDVILNGRQRQKTGGHRVNKLRYIKFRKQIEEPRESEGFDVVKTMPFLRRPESSRVKKALFFSLLSVTYSLKGYAYPTNPTDLRILADVNPVFRRYYDEGFALVGVANVPGIAMKVLSEHMAQECMLELVKQIQPPVDGIYYSAARLSDLDPTSMPRPHLAFVARDEHQLDLSNSIMIGQTRVDQYFASNANIGRFVHRDMFFFANRPNRSRLTQVEGVKKMFEDDET